MKITQDVCDYATTLNISDEEALKQAMQEKSIEFIKKLRDLSTVLVTFLLSRATGKSSPNKKPA